MRRGNQVLIVIVVILALGAGFGGGLLANSVSGGGGSKAGSQGPQQYDLLGHIKSAGVLRMGCSAAPPELQKVNGQWQGPDLIAAQAIATALNVKFECVDTSSQGRIPGLQAGRYDMIADFDATTERALSVSFSEPLWQYSAVFVLPSNATYCSAAAILASHKKVSSTTGTAPAEAAQSVGYDLDNYTDIAGSFLALTAGRDIADVTDTGSAETFVRSHPDYKILVPDPPIFTHGVAYGVPVNTDAHALQVINITMTNLISSGAVTRAFTAAGYVDEAHLGSMKLAC